MKRDDHAAGCVSRDRAVTVVGATSPLGRHLVEFLLANGYQVRALYRSGHGLPVEWRQNASFHGFSFDLQDTAALPCLLGMERQIVWLAQARENATGTPYRSDEDPGVVALRTICRLPAPAGRKIILLSSGGAIYGNPSSLPVNEDHPLDPLGGYGESKKCLEETLATHVGSSSGLSSVVLRCANIYGLHYLAAGARGCIGAFARALIGRRPLTLIAGGRAVRDFVHADDVVAAIMAGLNRPDSMAVWNVGSGEGIRIIEVLRMMCEILGREPEEVLHVAARPADVEEIYLDIAKIRREGPWLPCVPFRRGIESLLSTARSRD